MRGSRYDCCNCHFPNFSMCKIFKSLDTIVEIITFLISPLTFPLTSLHSETSFLLPKITPPLEPFKNHFGQLYCTLYIYIFYRWQVFMDITHALRTILDIRKVTLYIEVYMQGYSVGTKASIRLRHFRRMHIWRRKTHYQFVLYLVINFVLHSCILLLNVVLCIYDYFSMISFIFTHPSILTKLFLKNSSRNCFNPTP